jgi:probable HAF family extracellular repeat protein
MRMFNLGLAAALVVAALACTLSPPCLAADSYKVEELGTLLGGSSVGSGVNSAGQVVGWSGFRDRGDTRAFVWTRPGPLLSLGTLPGGDYSAAFAINQSGTVVGRSNTSTSTHAFVWTKGDGISDLGVLHGDSSSSALDINDRGQVVGASTGEFGSHAFLWSKPSGMRSLGALGESGSEARGINDAGAVVGVITGASKGSSGDAAFRWTDRDGVVYLGTLPDDTASEATRISDSGQVVGSSTGPAGTRAVLWTSDREIHNLGTLHAGVYSSAFDINGAGQVVGTSDASLGMRAFLWTREGGMVDLNALIPSDSNVVLISAQAINERGQIVAIGNPHHGSTAQASGMDHEQHAEPIYVFLLTPSGVH